MVDFSGMDREQLLADFRQEIKDALQADGITTAYLMRADFAAEPVFVWTGSHSLLVNNPLDALMNGQTFEPFQTGVVMEVGENAFSYTGSDSLQISLAVGDPLPFVLSEAAINAAEYKSRRFVLWRAFMTAAPGLGTPAMWTFERTRLGSMDQLEIRRGSGSANFVLTIESHAARISSATQSLWLDQKRFDPLDTSQDFASSAANGEPGGANGGYVGGGSGVGGILRNENVQLV